MENNQVETIYEWLDVGANIIAGDRDIPYLEALAEAGEAYFSEDANRGLSEAAAQKLEALIGKVRFFECSHESIRKAFQLAILKGQKEIPHPNRQMTPDTIGLFIGYLVNKFMESKKGMTLFDPAVGTGNLLLAVLNQLSHEAGKAFGSDIDDVLIKLAYVQANLQQKEIELFNQDSLQPIFMDPVDTVLCDLPVGYYPDDESAAAFQLKADEGHSFSHHLFIEQSLTYAKPGGYLFFMIPNHLFESSQSEKLRTFLKDHAHINAVLQLPSSIFKDEAHAKSILILQKHGEQAIAPKQVLLAQIPSFSNQEAMLNMTAKLDNWIRQEKN
ncbi:MULTISPECIES: class I SAM-dependent methyltransferase [unclassified Bacillus (in: firmicutes)]|uniref:class I SAM-dependent methyltransferase n=1 Tax=unclassified Bacillus (in: firmicutes) TaxID=185979 RepID=UPI00040BF0AD|nr:MULTISPECIES: class I SAM-dependent methyltransferase [unclassified Bacillus (in: firmicutes)]QHZ48046.1 class I SAM-dependent methyltransferase [Bacillus sp. NSP9.1]WFA04124.1 class I SAM-dependent methyltransferase [Bacillus sp. HSf4]